MSVDFKSFGKKADSAPVAADDSPKAEFWANVGYQSDVEDADGEKMFVSLPQGIPLDTLDPIKVGTRASEFTQFQQARNSLLEQLLDHVRATLQPGESTIVDLQIQVRRVAQEQAPVASDDNMFVKKLF